jgi:hypothetical protein
MRSVILALVLAVVLAACSGEIAPHPGPDGPGAVAPAPNQPTSSTSPIGTTTSASPEVPVVTTVDPFRTFVAWMPGGLVPEFGDALADLPNVRAASLARTGTLHIVSSRDASGMSVDMPPGGYVIPVEAVVLDPTTFDAFLASESAAALQSLGPDELILSEASAELRRLGVGGKIQFEGDIELTVAAVLPDAVLGSTEVAVTSLDAFAADNTIARFAVIESTAGADELETALLARLPASSVVRVRSREPGRADASRAVQPQVAIKQEFGEFAYRPPRRGTRVEIDPAWLEANIVVMDIPLLGQVRCHREYATRLAGVMQSLVDDDLQEVIDRSAFRGCWNPRYIAGTTRLSRHAFGVAADINFGNPLDGGPGSPVHPELLARMAAAGITSGHAWSAPDPGHFEFYSRSPIPTAP